MLQHVSQLLLQLLVMARDSLVVELKVVFCSLLVVRQDCDAATALRLSDSGVCMYMHVYMYVYVCDCV